MKDWTEERQKEAEDIVLHLKAFNEDKGASWDEIVKAGSDYYKKYMKVDKLREAWESHRIKMAMCPENEMYKDFSSIFQLKDQDER